MTTQVTVHRSSNLARAGIATLPAIVVNAGEQTARRFVEFFTATIRNKNTRTAYAHAVSSFLAWCDERGLPLERIDSLAVATYIEVLMADRSPPTVKQHLAAIRMCFDWLVSGGMLSVNPAWSVRGPKHVVKKGKTPVLSAKQAPRTDRLDQPGDRRPGNRGARARPRRAARPGPDRHDGLFVRPRRRGRENGREGLLAKRQALVATIARKGWQTPRSALPPQRRGLPRRVRRGRGHRRPARRRPRFSGRATAAAARSPATG